MWDEDELARLGAVLLGPEAVLDLLASVLEQSESLQAEAQRLVNLARGLGVTWAKIADVAGVKPQSAYQRWSETGRAKHAEYQRKRREAG